MIRSLIEPSYKNEYGDKIDNKITTNSALDEFGKLIYDHGAAYELSIRSKEQGDTSEEYLNLRTEKYFKENDKEKRDEYIDDIKEYLKKKYIDTEVTEAGFIFAVKLLNEYRKNKDEHKITRRTENTENKLEAANTTITDEEFITSIISLINTSENDTEEEKKKKGRNFDRLATMLTAFGYEDIVIDNTNIIKKEIPNFDRDLYIDNLYLELIESRDIEHTSEIKQEVKDKIRSSKVKKIKDTIEKFSDVYSYLYTGKFQDKIAKEILRDSGILSVENNENNNITLENFEENITYIVDNLSLTSGTIYEDLNKVLTEIYIDQFSDELVNISTNESNIVEKKETLEKIDEYLGYLAEDSSLESELEFKNNVLQKYVEKRLEYLNINDEKVGELIDELKTMYNIEPDKIPNEETREFVLSLFLKRYGINECTRNNIKRELGFSEVFTEIEKKGIYDNLFLEGTENLDYDKFFSLVGPDEPRYSILTNIRINSDKEYYDVDYFINRLSEDLKKFKEEPTLLVEFIKSLNAERNQNSSMKVSNKKIIELIEQIKEDDSDFFYKYLNDFELVTSTNSSQEQN